MRVFRKLLLAGGLVAPLALAACGSGSSLRKVVVDEGVCGGQVRLLRMQFGQTNRIILDNTKHSDQQTSMTINLDRFPVLVKGDIPAGSQIGTPFSTIRLTSAAGEQHSVDLQPTHTGTFHAVCNMTLAPPSGGKQIQQNTVNFELVQ